MHTDAPHVVGSSDGVQHLADALIRAIRGSAPPSRSVDASGDDLNEDSLFREASSRACANLSVRARQLPGRLLAEALSNMRRFLGSRGEAGVLSEQPRVLTYLETVFNQRYGRDAVGLRTSREMRTLAEAVDAMFGGDLL